MYKKSKGLLNAFRMHYISPLVYFCLFLNVPVLCYRFPTYFPCCVEDSVLSLFIVYVLRLDFLCWFCFPSIAWTCTTLVCTRERKHERTHTHTSHHLKCYIVNKISSKGWCVPYKWVYLKRSLCWLSNIKNTPLLSSDLCQCAEYIHHEINNIDSSVKSAILTRAKHWILFRFYRDPFLHLNDISICSSKTRYHVIGFLLKGMNKDNGDYNIP